jgi:hypothetical protein
MFLASTKVSTTVPVFVDPIVERYFIIDCSGSMYSDIRPIKEQMKKKIPTLTKVGDRISILWFSSKSQCDFVVQGFEINSKADYRILKEAIDKHLYARGCTGFKDPIDMASKHATAMKAAATEPTVAHMFFMTDGHDNCWSSKEIVDSVKKASESFDSMTFVEYGWGCNRGLLNQMASAVGASQVFSEDFAKYDCAFEDSLLRKVGPGTKKVQVSLPEMPVGELAFYTEGDDIICVDVEADLTAVVPEAVPEISYVTTTDPGYGAKDHWLLTGIYVMAQRMMSDEALKLLGSLGDKNLIDIFTNCFSKQDYSDFQVQVKACIGNDKLLYKEGKVFNYLPADDAFTVVDLLEELASDEDNLLYVHDENFKYERISAARVDTNTVVSDEEKEAALEQLKNAKTPEDIKRATEALQELSASKIALKFKPNVPNHGYAIKALVYNETRPNISVQVNIPGYVEIPEECPHKDALPKKVNTITFRNYAMVKDGIKHSSMKSLPMTLSAKTFKVLQEQGVLSSSEVFDAATIYVINANLPVINRKMVSKVSAKDFFTDIVAPIRRCTTPY